MTSKAEIERRLLDDELFQKGMAIRKEVVGEDYVAAAMRSADDFSMPLQELATKVCWGEIWARDGLPRAARSLVTLAMLAALNRSAELKTHIRGALRNGCTRVEIREVLLQTVVYCGFPAALEAFRIAREVFDETDRSAHS